MKETKFHTHWLADQKLLITEISGDATIETIENWEQSLYNTFLEIPEQSVFKILINLNLFSAIDLTAHQRFKNIIPLALAKYGWQVGYSKLFEEETAHIVYTNTRQIKCLAAAHVHHDRAKTCQYSTLFAHQTERFFTNPTLAMNWIKEIKI